MSALVLMRHFVGEFLEVDDLLIEVDGNPGGADTAERALRGFVAAGMERTIERGPGFAIRVMADVANKALSAAINDPTTAVHPPGNGLSAVGPTCAGASGLRTARAGRAARAGYAARFRAGHRELSWVGHPSPVHAATSRTAGVPSPTARVDIRSTLPSRREARPESAALWSMYGYQRNTALRCALQARNVSTRRPTQ